MNLNTRQVVMGLLLCTMYAGFTQTASARQCTLADVAGKYGFTSIGSIITPALPFAAVGRVTFTEQGTFSGAQRTSIGGNFSDETIEATFTVNPDCTGSAVVYIYRGSTLARTTNLLIVWDDHQREARGLFLTLGTAVTITARKMFGDD